MKKTVSAICALAAMLFFSLTNRGMSTDSQGEDGIAFQIVTDKQIYAPRASLHVKFIVTNTSEAPFYLSRGLGECSSQFGFAYFLIVDQYDHAVRNQGCAADTWPPLGQVDVIKELSDSRSWIKLNPGEIYGGESTFELPSKKGSYRLRAELMPPAFSDEQRRMLSQRGMRVLHSACPAPIVTITVK